MPGKKINVYLPDACVAWFNSQPPGKRSSEVAKAIEQYRTAEENPQRRKLESLIKQGRQLMHEMLEILDGGIE